MYVNDLCLGMLDPKSLASQILFRRSIISSWREPVLLIFILVSLSLRMMMGRWRSLQNGMLTRW
jgi:hypothetical protein